MWKMGQWLEQSRNCIVPTLIFCAVKMAMAVSSPRFIPSFTFPTAFLGLGLIKISMVDPAIVITRKSSSKTQNTHKDRRTN
jgi:hypothetical protein